MRVQNHPDRLQVRETARTALAEALDGERVGLPLEPSQITRWLTGEITNPVEVMLVLIDCLPAERSAVLLSCLEDRYEERHGAALGKPWNEITEAVEASAAVVRASARLRDTRGEWEPENLRTFASATARAEKEYREARRSIHNLGRRTVTRQRVFKRTLYDHEGRKAAERRAS
jgi:hypothetical protein